MVNFIQNQNLNNFFLVSYLYLPSIYLRLILITATAQYLYPHCPKVIFDLTSGIPMIIQSIDQVRYAAQSTTYTNMEVIMVFPQFYRINLYIFFFLTSGYRTFQSNTISPYLLIHFSSPSCSLPILSFSHVSFALRAITSIQKPTCCSSNSHIDDILSFCLPSCYTSTCRRALHPAEHGHHVVDRLLNKFQTFVEITAFSTSSSLVVYSNI